MVGWIACWNCGDSNTITDERRPCGFCGETLDFDMGVVLEGESD